MRKWRMLMKIPVHHLPKNKHHNRHPHHQQRTLVLFFFLLSEVFVSFLWTKRFCCIVWCFNKRTKGCTIKIHISKCSQHINDLSTTNNNNSTTAYHPCHNNSSRKNQHCNNDKAINTYQSNDVNVNVNYGTNSHYTCREFKSNTTESEPCSWSTNIWSELEELAIRVCE